MVVCSLGWLFGLAGPGPRQRAPSREGEKGKEGNGDARSSRESQEIQGRKPGGSATDGRCIYIRGPVPGKGRPERKQRENGARERMEPDGWLSVVWVGFWACGPRSPPEGPKQRRREGKRKATGTPEAAERARRFKEGSPGEVQQTGVAYI